MKVNIENTKELANGENTIRLIYFGDLWDNRWRRRQQIAYRLALMDTIKEVIYIEIPLTLISFIKYILGLGNENLRSRWKQLLKSGFVRSIDKVRIITPISIWPLYRFNKYTFLTEWFSEYITNALIRKHFPGHPHPCILWLSHPLAAHYIGSFGEVLICHDHTEKFSQYKSWSPDLQEKAGRLDDWISRKADLIFVQTEAQLMEKQQINSNTHLIQNAVDLDLYNNSQADIPEDIEKIKQPVLGYVGSMNYRLDYNLLSKLASEHPEWSLVLIGLPDKKSLHLLGHYQNVHFLGEKHYNVLPQYIYRFNVCLIPYILNDLTYPNPLKLFDYLASGRPVVSTAIHGVKGFEGPIATAGNYDEFINQIEWFLNNDKSAMSRQRKEVAKLHTWDVRTEQVWQLIEQRLYSECKA